MSLRSFHIFFIIMSILLMGFLTYWSGNNLAQGQDGWNLVFVVICGAGLAAGVPYLAWFVRKTKAL